MMNAAFILKTAALAIVEAVNMHGIGYRLRRLDALITAGRAREAHRLLAAVKRDLRVDPASFGPA